jgi:hypothetical protein
MIRADDIDDDNKTGRAQSLGGGGRGGVNMLKISAAMCINRRPGASGVEP